MLEESPGRETRGSLFDLLSPRELSTLACALHEPQLGEHCLPAYGDGAGGTGFTQED